jgi:hypothetical protein
VHRRPVAHSRWIATVLGGSIALCSRATIVPSDPTTRRHAVYANNVAGLQDATASIPLKTSFTSYSRHDPIE